MNFTLAPSVEVRPGSACLKCGLALTGATGVVANLPKGVPTPSPGDFSVCIGCGHIMAFGDRLEMRELTDREKASIGEDERVLLVRMAQRRLAAAKLIDSQTPEEK